MDRQFWRSSEIRPVAIRCVSNKKSGRCQTRLRWKARRCRVWSRDKPYQFSVSLGGPDKVMLQTVESTLTGTLDQTVLPDRPLVVGPVYTPNPDLAGHPDGKRDDLDRPPCK